MLRRRGKPFVPKLSRAGRKAKPGAERRVFKRQQAGIANLLQEAVRKHFESAGWLLQHSVGGERVNAKLLKKYKFDTRVLKEHYGFSAGFLRELEFKIDEVHRAGYSEFSLAQAEFSAEELKSVDIDARKLAVLRPSVLLRLGFKPLEMAKADIPPDQIRAAMEKRKKDSEKKH